MTDVGSVLLRRYSVTAIAALSDVDDRPIPYSPKARRYRPTRIEVTYDWTSEDSDQNVRVQLFGPVLYKNGTDGPSKSEDFWVKDSWPEWVKEFVGANRPPTGVRAEVPR